MSVMTTVLDGPARPVRWPRPTQRPAQRPVTAPERAAERASETVAVRARTEPAPIAWRTVAPTASERAWGVLAHLSGAVASVAGPLLIARAVGQRSRYVREQATAAANFQLAFLAALAPMLLLGVLTFGFALLFLVPLVLAWLLTTLLAATAAAGGERYRYPVGLPVVR